MATLQVKGIDDRLYAALGARAAKDKRSISQEVVFIIEEFLSRSPSDHRAATSSALELAGSGMTTVAQAKSPLICESHGGPESVSERAVMFFLDTDTLVFLCGNTKVVEAFAAHDTSPKAFSVISYGELLYGAYKSAKPVENASKVHRLRAVYPVFNVSLEVMETFSRLRADMDRDGKRIDDFDLLIASTAIHLGYTLVTNNERHFRQVPDLPIENWSK